MSQPQDRSSPLLRTALGETEAQKSDPPKAPQNTRPERLGLGLLTPQTLKPQQIKPPNSELLPLALRSLRWEVGMGTELPKVTRVGDCRLLISNKISLSTQS